MATKPTMTSATTRRRHEHEFTALWSHLGPFGRQGVHLHYCFGENCHEVIVGEGQDCGGKDTPHARQTLAIGGAKGRWKEPGTEWQGSGR